MLSSLRLRKILTPISEDTKPDKPKGSQCSGLKEYNYHKEENEKALCAVSVESKRSAISETMNQFWNAIKYSSPATKR